MEVKFSQLVFLILLILFSNSTFKGRTRTQSAGTSFDATTINNNCRAEKYRAFYYPLKLANVVPRRLWGETQYLLREGQKKTFNLNLMNESVRIE